MSKTLAVSLVGVTGATGTVAVGAYHFGVFSSKIATVADKLKEEKYVLLKANDPTHSDHWTKSLEKYKEKYQNKNSYTKEELQNLCKDLLNKENIEIYDYKEARKYCVVPSKISERLKVLGLTVLDTSGSGDTDKWKALSKEYKTKGVDSKKLDDLVSTNISDETSSGNLLKEKCKSVFDKEHWDDNYDSLIKNSESWCTLQGFNDIS